MGSSAKQPRQTRRKERQVGPRVAPAVTWRHLDLPRTEVERLRVVVQHVADRQRLMKSWRFGCRRRTGTIALFDGPWRAGKLLAAEAIAQAVDRDLYRVDLSAIVSKYIGETERNLRRVFDTAEGSDAILFFDEADALFGKRADVRNSHDRYASAEISYLLQRLERYEGLAILATNRTRSIDPAFLRRVACVVRFRTSRRTRRRRTPGSKARRDSKAPRDR
jgi:SpoVK/Ycf46/Vps4 family AAA+-type ATPase